MPPVSLSVAVTSFAVAAIAYLLMLALIAPLGLRTWISRWLFAATLTSALWAVALLGIVWRYSGFTEWILAVDSVHVGVWVLLVAALLSSSGMLPSGGLRPWLRWSVFLGVAAAIALSLPLLGNLMPVRARFLIMIALPLAGLFGLEQVFRNSSYEERYALKPLAIGVGAIFAIDIFVYSQSLLFEDLAPFAWASRGFVAAAVVPLLLIAAKRSPNWGETLFVSRQVVFYSTTLTAVGIYLLGMALGGYLIAISDLAWGALLQVLFLVLAGGVLAVVLFSQALRNRLRVFIAKHFYRNRYDYREEWLKLIHTLADNSTGSSLPQRSVKALADIIGSSEGELFWLSEDQSAFEPQARWGAITRSSAAISADDPLARFVAATRWVVDTDECRRDPEKYSNAFVSTAYADGAPAIYIPLTHESRLVGIVRLDRPPGIGDLGYEDHDLLKTAGQQAAIFLVQEHNQEELSESRQFEAFSRLTAFLMHDLKNMIAQQELIVGNAKRFKDRPEFIDDAISTIDRCVQRMRSVLDRLQAAGRRDHTVRVDVSKVVREVVEACADRRPVPHANLDGAPLWVSMDRDKLGMALTHAVRNAQDATDSSGRIEIRAGQESGVVIEIEDNGTGMDQDFIEQRLFKPFESTKGAQGMGIGAYQIRETVRAAGGEVSVTSEPGRGTVVRISLPSADNRDLPDPGGKVAQAAP